LRNQASPATSHKGRASTHETQDRSVLDAPDLRRHWTSLRNIVWFRGHLTAKARDFNWHNTIGFWSAVPLAIIVLGATVISYPWATALVYRAFGEQPPAPAGALRSVGSERASAASREATANEPVASSVALDMLIASAESQMPEWKTISVALPQGRSPRVVLTLDAGDGGQPQKRATLTLDRHTGAVELWEPSASQSPGRRARPWLRFAHTGEVYGLIGQSLAGAVSLGGAALVWTGIALALRRLASARTRGRAALPKAA